MRARCSIAVQQPDALWEMAIERRYAALWPDIETRMGPAGGTAIDGYARTALDAYANAPQDAHALLDAARAFLAISAASTTSPRPRRAATIAPGMSEEQVEIVLADADAQAAAGHRDARAGAAAPVRDADLSTTPEAAGALIGSPSSSTRPALTTRSWRSRTPASAAKARLFLALRPGLAAAQRGLRAVRAQASRRRGQGAGDALKAVGGGQPGRGDRGAALRRARRRGGDDRRSPRSPRTEGADRLADQFQPDGALLPHAPSPLRALWARC